MKQVVVATLIVLSALLGGCAVYMAARQPEAKDLDLFKPGTSRALLIAEFGAPAISEIREGRKFEIFRFRQGYGRATKAGRAMFHGVVDVLTLGIWELFGTPTEVVFSGAEMAFQVRYDDQDRVDEAVELKRP